MDSVIYFVMKTSKDCTVKFWNNLITGSQQSFDNKIWKVWDFQNKQDKYTMNPGWSTLSQQKEKNWSTKTNKENA